jgi:protein-tyrosine phosphatase
LNVLFVCTGNICRSPMAERLARQFTADDDVRFTSAGTATHPRVEPSAGTVEAMAEVGIAVEDHRSQSVWEVGDAADVIYALSGEHRDAMLRRWPDRIDDIHLLRPDGESIADPYGLGIDDYRRTRDEIEAAVRARVEAGWRPR